MKTCLINKLAVVLLSGIMTENASAEIVRKERKFRLLEVSSQNFVEKTAPVQIGVVAKNQSRIQKNLTQLRSLVSEGHVKILLSDEQIRALILTESGGKAGLVGDKHLGDDPNLWAWGKLQIRKCYVDDVNKRFGTNILASDCLWEAELSILVTQAYMNIYASDKSFEHRAKVHNGGPAGPKVPKTTGYWAKVQSKLQLVRAESKRR